MPLPFVLSLSLSSSLLCFAICLFLSLCSVSVLPSLFLLLSLLFSSSVLLFVGLSLSALMSPSLCLSTTSLAGIKASCIAHLLCPVCLANNTLHSVHAVVSFPAWLARLSLFRPCNFQLPDFDFMCVQKAYLSLSSTSALPTSPQQLDKPTSVSKLHFLLILSFDHFPSFHTVHLPLQPSPLCLAAAHPSSCRYPLAHKFFSLL